MNLVRERYSVRKFEQKPVEKEKVISILEAARLAPTAKNAQPERILIIDEEAALEKLKGCTSCHYCAPLVFVVGYDSTECYKREQDGQISGEIDAAIVTTHMMLQAASIDLGTTWVMNFDPIKLREEFHIPERIKPTALLVCGYPGEDSKPSLRHSRSQELSRLCRFNSFDEEERYE